MLAPGRPPLVHERIGNDPGAPDPLRALDSALPAQKPQVFRSRAELGGGFADAQKFMQNSLVQHAITAALQAAHDDIFLSALCTYTSSASAGDRANASAMSNQTAAAELPERRADCRAEQTAEN